MFAKQHYIEMKEYYKLHPEEKPIKVKSGKPVGRPKKYDY